jgi:hypothetical protein
VEAGSNTSTVTLRVVGGDEKGSLKSDNKLSSQVPKDSDQKKATPARTSSIYKRQTRPLVREGTPQKQDRNCQTVIDIWSWGSTPRLTDWLTVSPNLTLTLTFLVSRKCELVAGGSPQLIAAARFRPAGLWARKLFSWHHVSILSKPELWEIYNASSSLHFPSSVHNKTFDGNTFSCG